jgi:hypothetical protein
MGMPGRVEGSNLSERFKGMEVFESHELHYYSLNLR